jgi:hypothetical protein
VRGVPVRQDGDDHLLVRAPTCDDGSRETRVSRRRRRVRRERARARRRRAGRPSNALWSCSESSAAGGTAAGTVSVAIASVSVRGDGWVWVSVISLPVLRR